MKIGQSGDSLSLARVFAAMLVGALALGAVGFLFDLAVGPAIGMTGWWTVFAHGGLILGAMLQATREFATPQPAERRVVAAEQRAREAAEAERAPAGDPEAAHPSD